MAHIFKTTQINIKTNGTTKISPNKKTKAPKNKVAITENGVLYKLECEIIQYNQYIVLREQRIQNHPHLGIL